MTNKNWNRVPGILQTVTQTFSTESERESVMAFHTKLQSLNKLGKLESTFTNMLTNIDKNIKWREQHEDQIINWIMVNHNSASGILMTVSMILLLLII